MRKLTKLEIRFLTYLDQHLDDVHNKTKALKFLKDDLGLDSKEAAHLYSIWYYTKGEGEYSELDYDDENTLLSFIKKMSSFNSDDERSASRGGDMGYLHGGMLRWRADGCAVEGGGA